MRSSLVLLPAALLSVSAFAKQAPSYDFTLLPPQVAVSEYSEQGRVSALSRVPQTLYGLSQSLLPGTPEDMAREFLRTQAATLQLRDADLSDLTHVWTRSSKAGHNVHFEQRLAGVPVYASRMVVHVSPDSRVNFVTSGYQPQASLSSVQPLLSAEQARTALIERLQAKAPFRYDQTQLNVYATADATHLVWRVQLEGAQPQGSWEAMVDAQNGDMLVLWDRAAYASATVFNPDPLSSSGTQYGGSITDNNDADYPAIANEVVTVDLGDITQSAGLYYLSDPWAELVDTETPNKGFYEQAAPDFSFTREQDGFEAVHTFWHIQQSMRYINETLGIALRPYQYEGGVRFDPHGLDGDDNSHYSSGSGELAFGEGCVDDDEDADVVLHELGHGLHDWVTDGGLSNMIDGLSEGFGDYWAQSYSRSLGQWGTSNPEYQWVFSWDGHNECWAGRVTNIDLPYPSSVQPYPAVHSGGQHWSTCLMKIHDELGREKTDSITLEGLAMTHLLSSQIDAANAVAQAAADLGLPANEVSFITDTFSSCGYVMGLPVSPDPTRMGEDIRAIAGGLVDNSKFGGALNLSLLAGMIMLSCGLRRR